MDEHEASRRLLGARRDRRLIVPIAAEMPAFSVADGYRVAKLNHDSLIASGEIAVGRKIGFTNRGIWDEYKVYQPIWAHMYASTVRHADGGEASVPSASFCQPRIEPEIIVKLGRAPETAEPDAIAECVEWIAHGYEIVDCHFARWKFAAADTIADFGLHAALFVGARIEPAKIPDFIQSLSAFEIELSRDGTAIDHGSGRNVLDGPLQAIAHLMKVLAAQNLFAPLAAGEIITTGTLTAAWPVAAGQRWETRLQRIGLPGFRLSFT
jgi:2-oxo-3-hexenedioate decarboxylase